MNRYGLLSFCLALLTSLSALGQGSGNALRFFGTNDYADINFVANNTRSIEMWFKPSTTINSSNVTPDCLIARDFNNGNINNNNEFGLVFQSTFQGNAGKLEFFRYIGTTKHRILSDDDVWYADRWYHVAAVIDPAVGMRMYINGVLQADTNTTTNAIPNVGGFNNDVRLAAYGGNLVGWQWDYSGDIDEVRIWDDARTETEVKEYMCQKLDGTESDLKAYYNCDVNTNAILIDASTTNNNGTILGGAIRVTSGAPIGDTSIYIYPTSFAGLTFSLNYAPGDSIRLTNMSSTSDGLHIYREDSSPNSQTNLPANSTTNYYGVFFTDTSASFDAVIDYSGWTPPATCTGNPCNGFYARDNNAVTSWTPDGDSLSNCEAFASGQSAVGTSRRVEYVVIPEIAFNSNLGNDSLLCSGDTVFLDAFTSGATYEWQDNSTNSTFTATTTGTYIVTVTVGSCFETDSVDYVFNPTPVVDLVSGPDTFICPGDTAILDGTFPGNPSYLWQDGSTNPTFPATAAGMHGVGIQLANCFYTDSIFVNILPVPTLDIGPDTAVCDGSGFFLDASIANSTYTWQDGSTGAFFTPVQTGWHVVDALFSGECPLSDSAFITVNPVPTVDLGPDTALCPGETLMLDATFPNATYDWQDNSTLPTFTVTGPGLYFVNVDALGCVALDGIVVNYATDPNLNLGPDTSFCDGNSLTLDATTTNATYTWQDGTTNATFNTVTGGDFWVEIDLFGCTYSDTMSLIVNPIPVIQLPNDTTLCPWDQISLDASFNNATYLWNDSSTVATQNITTPGNYVVTVTSLGCTYADSILVNHYGLPTVELGNDTFYCEDFSYTLDAFFPGAFYQWSNGTTGSSITPTTSGTYSVTVDLNMCPITDQVTVTILPVPSVDLGPDEVLCEGENFLIDATTPNAFYTWQDLSTSNTYTATQTGTYYVEVSLGVCTDSDSIDLTFLPIPTVELGPDSNLCDGETMVLNASYPGGSYLWSTGEVTAEIQVDTEDEYFVTVSLGNCSTKDSAIVTVTNIPVFDLGPDVNLCEGQDSILDPMLSTVPGVQYVWQDSASSPTYRVSKPGVYTLLAQVNRCTYRDTAVYTFDLLPSVQLGNDTTLCEEETFIVRAEELTGQKDEVTYLWSTDSDNDAILVSEPGLYEVEVNNACGSSTANILVDYIRCRCDIFAPNAFTPNVDSKNERFNLEFNCEFQEYKFTIYNRLGEVLFTSRDPGASWDGTVNGKLAAQGTYVWELSYKALQDDGKAPRRKEHGRIALLR